MNLKTAEKNLNLRLITNFSINLSATFISSPQADSWLYVEDPDQAFMTPEMKETVRDVAKYFRTAIVSGRSRTQVFNFVQLFELYYAGSHGMDIEGPSEGVYESLVEKTKVITGSSVEKNKFCLSVHYRNVDEKRWTELINIVQTVIQEYPKLKLTHGKMVLEIRPSIRTMVEACMLK